MPCRQGQRARRRALWSSTGSELRRSSSPAAFRLAESRTSTKRPMLPATMTRAPSKTKSVRHVNAAPTTNSASPIAAATRTSDHLQFCTPSPYILARKQRIDSRRSHPSPAWNRLYLARPVAPTRRSVEATRDQPFPSAISCSCAFSADLLPPVRTHECRRVQIGYVRGGTRRFDRPLTPTRVCRFPEIS